MSGVAWSQQEETFLRENYYNLGPKDCAFSLGRGYSSVYQRATKTLGLFSYQHSSICNESFFKDWTSSNSYCFGLLVSDGCMSEVVRSKHLVTLEMTDRDVMDIFAECTRSKVRVIKRDGFKDSFCVNLGGSKNYSLLYKKSLRPNKSCKEVWPSIPTPELIWSFVRGIHDGDGCVSYSGNRLAARFYGGRVFLEHLKNFLESEGISCPFVRKEKGKIYKLGIYRYLSIKLLYEKMYKNSEGFRMARKYACYKEYLERNEILIAA